MGATSRERPRKGSPPTPKQARKSAGSESAGRAVSETLLGEAAASGRAAMVLSDDDLHYIAANDEACRLLGYERSELLAVRVSDVIPKPPARLSRRSREIARGKPTSGRTAVRHNDGSTFEIEYLSIASTVAGLPYVLTIFWPAGS